MKPSEIISADLQRNGKDPAESIKAIAMGLKAKTLIQLQENNSILLLRKIGKGIVELHLFTVDSPLKVAKSVIQFIKKIKASDIKQVYGKADNPQIVQLLKNMDVPVKNSDKEQYNWMAKV
jgi:hypothetical protein